MLSDLYIRLRSLFRRTAAEMELDQELHFHLEQQAEKYMQAGLTREQALRRLRLEFGGLAQIKEDCREARGIAFLETMAQDVRYALRTFGRDPGFTTVVVLTLALGIGANTAIFSLINAALLKMLPVRDPEQLVQFNTINPAIGQNDFFPYPAFQRFRQKNDAFSGILAFANVNEVDVEVNGQGQVAKGQVVSGDYFSTLGVTAMLGRTIAPQDDQVAGGGAVAVISYSFWRDRLAGDPGIVGKKIVLNNYPFTIIGVTPPEFFGLQPGAPVDVSVPLTMIGQIRPGFAMTGSKFDVLTAPFRNWLHIMGRLQPGVTNSAAVARTEPVLREAMDDAAEALAGTPLDSPEAPQIYRQSRLRFTAGGQGMAALRQRFSKPLLVLMAAVGLLLLIACANVANLLLARAQARQREIAARLMLGARRLRLVRQLITESVLLAGAGGVLGMVLAFWASGSLVKLMAHGRSPIVLAVRPDGRVLGFTLLICVLTALLFGLIPALRAVRTDIPSGLLPNVHSSAQGQGRSRTGKALIALQVAASLVLMVGAGLLVRSLQNLKNFYPGFTTDNLLLFYVNPGTIGYTVAQTDALYRRLVDQIDALPGVRGTSFSMDAPLSGESSNIVPKIEGYKPPSGRGTPVGLNIVGPQYFTTLKTPVLLGRDFTAGDNADAPKVAIINKSMARDIYGDISPVGRRISIPDWVADTSWYVIIGVVADTKSRDLRDPVIPMLYVPLEQSAVPSGVTFQIRTVTDAARAVPLVLRTVAQADQRLPVVGVRTLNDQLEYSLIEERLVASLAGLFGVLALLLACVGLYGVMAYTVSRKTNEIGIRVALGSGRIQIAGMILREALLMVLAGLTLGIPAAMGAARLMRSQLYGLGPDDPMTMLLAVSLMTVVALLACYFPAKRAVRIDPMQALRYE